MTEQMDKEIISELESIAVELYKLNKRISKMVDVAPNEALPNVKKMRRVIDDCYLDYNGEILKLWRKKRTL